MASLSIRTKAKAPKLPKGYKPIYTTYKVVTETTYDKPYKPSKVGNVPPSKEYVQKVKIVNPGAIKGSRRKGR